VGKVLSLIAATALTMGVFMPAPASATAAAAAARAASTVTIHANEGNFWGYLTSPRPKRCADHRKVLLYAAAPKLVSRVIATTVSSLRGGRYRWSIKGPAVHGHFFARVVRTPYCKRDTSNFISTPNRPSVRAVVPWRIGDARDGGRKPPA
jgi:hypothetical protein